MRLHEYRGKGLLAAHGIPVPEGAVAASAAEARAIAKGLGGRVVVKAQVLMGGRGKAGGIVRAATADEAAEHAARLLEGGLASAPVRRVLVERAADITSELYLGVALDRGERRMLLMVSPSGGVDIEQLARGDPARILRLPIDPSIGLRGYHLSRAARMAGVSAPLRGPFAEIARALYACACAADATLAEINPLVVTGDGGLLALDAKIVIDDSALGRHPEMADWRDPGDESEAEREAREADLSYVKLPGRVGCMVNGAGLAMATMDVLRLHGAEPANFLDVGGGARAERVALALRLILSDPDVAAILVNIFGGITRCDEVARGLVAALEETGATVPVVIRLVGTNEEEGRRILGDAGLSVATSLPEGARLAVAAAGGAR